MQSRQNPNVLVSAQRQASNSTGTHGRGSLFTCSIEVVLQCIHLSPADSIVDRQTTEQEFLLEQTKQQAKGRQSGASCSFTRGGSHRSTGCPPTNRHHCFMPIGGDWATRRLSQVGIRLLGFKPKYVHHSGTCQPSRILNNCSTAEQCCFIDICSASKFLCSLFDSSDVH